MLQNEYAENRGKIGGCLPVSVNISNEIEIVIFFCNAMILISVQKGCSRLTLVLWPLMTPDLLIRGSSWRSIFLVDFIVTDRPGAAHVDFSRPRSR
jgi:hypothetical protein